MFRHHDIPLDAFWLDLDYMQDKVIFTVNEQNYPSRNLNQIFTASDIKLVPLIDVGFAINDDSTSRMGRQLNIWLKSTKASEYYYKG